MTTTAKTRRSTKAPPVDPDHEYGATAAVRAERSTDRLKVWLKWYFINATYFVVPAGVVAGLGGPGKLVGVPFSDAPRPLLLVALALGFAGCTAQYVGGWWLRRAGR